MKNPTTTMEAARIISCSRAWIDALKARGELHGVQLDNGVWLFDRAEVEELAARRKRARDARRPTRSEAARA